MNVSYITPSNIKKVFDDLSQQIYDQFEDSDRQLTHDRRTWDIENTDYQQLKSTEPSDMEDVYHQDLQFISVLVCQLVLFRRIVRQNKVDSRDMGFPKGHVPLSFKFTEEWDKSSGKEIKEWVKNNYETLQSLKSDGWKDFFRSVYIYNQLSKERKLQLKKLYS